MKEINLKEGWLERDLNSASVRAMQASAERQRRIQGLADYYGHNALILAEIVIDLQDAWKKA